MKLGITVSTFQSRFGPIVFRGSDIQESVKVIKECGYEGVDLFIDRKSESELAELRTLFKKEGIEISMMIAIFLAELGVNLSDKEKEKRLEGIEEYKKQIIAAQNLGAKRMPIGFLRGSKNQDETEHEYFDRLSDSIGELLGFAQQHSVVLCIEPINRYEINTLNTVGEGMAFIEKYNLTGLKLLADTFHMNIEDVSIEESILKAGNLIEHFHAADSNRLAPGWGHLNFDSIIASLNKIGYGGSLAVEVFPEPDAVSCAKQAADFLKKRIGG